MSTLSPKSLEGKYEVLAKLREGGMGAIYKVRHRLLNELRVIKVMRPDIAQSADQRKRFVREAQTATRLRHPNIVAFYDFFVDDEDTAYMVMEYIEGINLRDTIRQLGPFPVSLGLDLSRQCLSAFEYLHRKGIIHRDVSPDNIMMTRDEDGTVRAKLIDLGIAKIAQASEELTAADEFIGKLRYSSPEQLMKSASSEKIDSRSDLFSFGVVVYELLTGVCPYGGENIHEIVTNRLNEPPLSFTESDAIGRLSPALRETVMKALQKRPEDRFQTAAEFGKALEALASTVATKMSAEQDARYAYSALTKALALEPVEKTTVLPPAVKTQREIDVGGLPADDRDLKFRRTIAGWSATTPPAPDADAGTLLDRDRKAPLPVPSAPAATASTHPVVGEPERARKTAVVGYAAVAISAALLVGFGVWIARRDRAAESLPVGARTPVESSVDVAEKEKGSSPAEPAGGLESRRDAAAAPRPAPPSPSASGASVQDTQLSKGTAADLPSTSREPTQVAGGTSGAPSAAAAGDDLPARKIPPPTARPKLRPTQAPRVAQLLPTNPPPRRGGEAGGDTRPQTDAGSASSAPQPTLPKMRYCGQFERTAYEQGVVRDVPSGFEDMATKAPRPDSGLMKISISLSTEKPVDDQPFAVVVRFVNEGDSRVDLQRLEESASRGGTRPVAGAAVPVSVSPGGIKDLYRYQHALSGGEPYNKQFIAIDGKGDSWRTGFRMVPCAD